MLGIGSFQLVAYISNDVNDYRCILYHSTKRDWRGGYASWAAGLVAMKEQDEEEKDTLRWIRRRWMEKEEKTVRGTNVQ